MSRYSPRYLMEQAARGRTVHGSPEDHLWTAVRSLNTWGLREAWAMGASPHARDGEGDSVLGALTEVGLRRDPQRLVALLAESWRQGARLNERSPRDIQVFLQWLVHPHHELWRFCCERPTLPWRSRDAQGRSVLEHVVMHAPLERLRDFRLGMPLGQDAWTRANAQGETPEMLFQARLAATQADIPSRAPRP